MSTPQSTIARRYVGILNQGSTCYLNSIIQALYHLPRFRYAIYNLEKSKNAPLCKELGHIFALLEARVDNIRTNQLTAAFGWHSCEVTEQHDAHELIQQLFDGLETELKDTPHANFIKDLFAGLFAFRSRVINGPVHVSDRLQEFYDLEVVVKNKKSIIESLNELVAPKKIEGVMVEISPNSPPQRYDIEMSQRFFKLPSILLIHPNRVDFDPRTYELVLLGNRWEFSLVLNLSDYCVNASEMKLDKESLSLLEKANINKESLHHSSNSERNRKSHADHERSKSSKVNATYRLRSIVTHAGESNNGHYYTYVRIENDDWICFNDEHVETASVMDVERSAFGGNINNSNVNPINNERASLLVYINTECERDILHTLPAPKELLEKAIDRERRLNGVVHDGYVISNNTTISGDVITTAASAATTGNSNINNNNYNNYNNSPTDTDRNVATHSHHQHNNHCHESKTNINGQCKNDNLSADNASNNRIYANHTDGRSYNNITNSSSSNNNNVTDNGVNRISEACNADDDQSSGILQEIPYFVCSPELVNVMDNVPGSIQPLLHRATFNKPLGKEITFEFLKSVIASDLNVPISNVRFVRPAIREIEPDKYGDNDNRTSNNPTNENDNANRAQDDGLSKYPSLANIQLPVNVYVVEIRNVMENNNASNKELENKTGNKASFNAPFWALFRRLERHKAPRTSDVQVLHSRTQAQVLLKEAKNKGLIVYCCASNPDVAHPIQEAKEIPDGANLIVCSAEYAKQDLRNFIARRQITPTEIYFVDRLSKAKIEPIASLRISDMEKYNSLQRIIYNCLLKGQKSNQSKNFIANENTNNIKSTQSSTINNSNNHNHDENVNGGNDNENEEDDNHKCKHTTSNHEQEEERREKQQSNKKKASNTETQQPEHVNKIEYAEEQNKWWEELELCCELELLEEEQESQQIQQQQQRRDEARQRLRQELPPSSDYIVLYGVRSDVLNLPDLPISPYYSTSYAGEIEELQLMHLRGARDGKQVLFFGFLPAPIDAISLTHRITFNAKWGLQPQVYLPRGVKKLTLAQLINEMVRQVGKLLPEEVRQCCNTTNDNIGPDICQLRLITTLYGDIQNTVTDMSEVITFSRDNFYVLDIMEKSKPGEELINVLFCHRRADLIFFGYPTNIYLSTIRKESGMDLRNKIANKLGVPRAKEMVKSWIASVQGMKSQKICTAGVGDILQNLVDSVGGPPYRILIDRPEIAELDGVTLTRNDRSIVIKSSSVSNLTSLENGKEKNNKKKFKAVRKSCTTS